MTLPVVFTANGQAGYNLTKSLRFRSSASAYLNRTPASAGNRRTWTWSAWVKRGDLTDFNMLFGATSSTSDAIGFRSSSTGLYPSSIYFYLDDLTGGGVYTNAVFRDPSAWYHIVLAVDTTQATSSNRIKLYINGTQQTFVSATYPTQNYDCRINNNVLHNIGAVNGATFLSGYLAEVNFVDGQALTPSSFGETSTTTGVWIPKKFSGTYGTNGFYLPFTDTTSTSTLGTDFSGNSNTWTVNNISLTAGATYDSMNDVPTLTNATTANYCTLNPLASRSVGTMQNGNLTWKKSDAAGDNYCCASSISIPSSGKWYWEVTVTDGASGANSIGIIPDTSTLQQTSNVIPGDFGITTNAFGYYSDGTKLTAASPAAYGNSFTTGDVIGVAVDTTNGKIWWSKNGTFQASGDPAAGTNAAFTTLSGSYYAASSVRFNGNQHDYNFNQRPFSYTPPTGFVALNTFNLPTPTIGATASSQANKYMDVTTYTGDGTTTRSQTSLNFQPDFVWLKSRSLAIGHTLFDSVRTAGATKALYSNSTEVEGGTSGSTASAEFGYISSFNSNGFSTSSGSVNGNYVNSTSNTYVGWQWKANGSGSTNTAGSITSTVSASTTAGFSIVTYTGNGTSSQTCGHGLGVTPSMVIWKNRNDVDSWIVYHNALTTSEYLVLNTTAAKATVSGLFTGISSTLLPLNNVSAAINANGFNYVAYCFAPVAGYSAFGSYTGNNSSDGTFVYLGFRPKFVLFKNASAGSQWILLDTSRNTYNVANAYLEPNTSDAENTASNVCDILSNGFKIRTTGTDFNDSSNTYIYACFAENPFKYANAR